MRTNIKKAVNDINRSPPSRKRRTTSGRNGNGKATQAVTQRNPDKIEIDTSIYLVAKGKHTSAHELENIICSWSARYIASSISALGWTCNKDGNRQQETTGLSTLWSRGKNMEPGMMNKDMDEQCERSKSTRNENENCHRSS